ncbi:DUF1761 family protein [Microbacterium sp. PMB16]|uniref:DUF1761 family protein n=1 Tax=Microbacterium sp. PMB16 TaxID=3120157 RepID=UPI003F4BE079
MIVLGIAIATVASFIASAALYAIPPVAATVARTSTPRPGLSMMVQMASVLIRSLIASCLIVGILIAADWHGPIAGMLLGLALSVLPLTLLMGGVVHENTALSAAAIHLADWVVKLALIGTLVGLFV